jgi:tetratricopeptide (TPR) repeat protein
MPANPGKNRSAEKQKKKRAAAQQARKVKTAAARARAATAAAEPIDEEAAPHPFAPSTGREVDYDALDEANEEIKELVKKKKLDDAEKKARALAAEFPEQSDGLQRLAEVLVARGKKAEARAALQEALSRPNEGDSEARAEIEKALAKLG